MAARRSGSYGSSRRFAQRERSPRSLAPAERPAVATLRHLIDREEAYKKSTGRYGTFAEMARGAGFALDVPVGATSFTRKGYRFELTVEEDGFRITAVPGMPGPRSFLGDDTGFIRAGLEARSGRGGRPSGSGRWPGRCPGPSSRRCP